MARMARVVSSDDLDFGCYKFWKEDRVPTLKYLMHVYGDSFTLASL